MQDPAREIDSVVHQLTAAASPDLQKRAIHRFFAPDASFRHPLAHVPPAPNSRESILSIYQWYRILSPHIELAVSDIAYIPEQNTIYLTVTQKFHVRFVPFPPAPVRLLVRITLRPVSTDSESPILYHIASQEDFYHTDALAAIAFPPLAIPARMLLRLSAAACAVLARGAQVVFGTWQPRAVEE
ncbi:hypothetical protein HETIRDRAFT_455189 [Heterobasidion irregulare TC 32-1]|uniref:SigF-like NTF2-like domain-containing protein n=1 Tax=Heterobasidion irregulare (strain TC 32-1) TaxID=747525 RepID=W4JTA3_HETIT|nr:uncharacterized protein HETIRDRAFT_455189 [Heterobasidion irregulare TC 32-1]ETW76694.1 hypothetical protein HETIRDRAFT_455189 [Heterobasidion irregulare TC 32-1]